MAIGSSGSGPPGWTIGTGVGSGVGTGCGAGGGAAAVPQGCRKREKERDKRRMREAKDRDKEREREKKEESAARAARRGSRFMVIESDEEDELDTEKETEFQFRRGTRGEDEEGIEEEEGGEAKGKPERERWSCSACTYINYGHMAKCQVCGSRRGRRGRDEEEEVKEDDTKRLRVDVSSRLADEMLLHVFAFLDFSSLCSVACVCRRWWRLCGDESLWNNLLHTACGRFTLRSSWMTQIMQEYAWTKMREWVAKTTKTLLFIIR
jgi:hypothetical protein